jgi:hyperosmotically inducible periplasmic protein
MKHFKIAATALLLGMAVITGCTTITGETTGEYIDDATITTQVKGIVLKDPDAHSFKIDVTTTNGNVVLQGFVNTMDTENRLIAKIRQVKGVKSLQSLLTVENKS